MLLMALLGGWLITFLANITIGTMALYMESSHKLMDVWLVLFFVLSGYMYPVELFPPWLRTLADWLPFRYQIGAPVELMTNAHGWQGSLLMLARQWTWVLLLGLLAVTLWRRALRRFSAFGG
jgi:ABC-2 type transport system permease protein